VGAPKRIAAGTLAAALSLFGLALAPSAGAAASVTTARIAGADRYVTAQSVATDASLTGGTMAILASGADANFPDALAASGLAGANAPAPIVLTEPTVYTAAAKAALATLKGKGVTSVTIVGGTDAVSATVATAVTADGFTVTRVAGVDRYETAGAIAAAQNTKKTTGSISSLKAAFIATGANFPDALAAGPAAYSGNLPILLVNSTGVPAATTKAITDLGIKKVYILGGTDAVPATVEATLVVQTGNAATRLAGVDKNETATKIADFEKANTSFVPTEVFLTTGLKAADALAVGPLAGQRKAPILLTASIPPVTASWLDANSSTINKITATGGTDAISDADLASAKASAENTGNDSASKAVTTRPELTGASIVATTTSLTATPTNPAGTTVRFTFDEPLGSAFGTSASSFHVYSASSGGTATDNGLTATVETTAPATGTTVLVNFQNIATPTGAAALTKATVDFGAVKDVGGAENPEGDAPVGTAGTTAPVAGTTTAPDLLSVGNFRQALTTGFTAVDFTFDQAAYAATSSGFHLVDVNNFDRPCTGPSSASDTTAGGGTSAGGSGTTVITVTCANAPVSTTLYSTANVARGYIVGGSVTTTVGGAGPTPQEAADVAANTTGPDLVSVSVTAGTTNDTAVYTFDTAIANATGSSFRLYTSTGAPLIPSGSGICTPASSTTDVTTCAINSSNPTQVLVRFAAASTSSAVGGYALGDGTAGNSAVFSAAAAGNQPDEEGTGGTSTTVTPGRNAGPDLTAVALATATDAFGNTSGYSATYTFDVAIAAGAATSSANFFLYLADGTRWRAGTCTTSTVTTTNVTCTGYTNYLTSAAPVTTALGGSVLGTVDNNAVTALSGGLLNSEGAAPTTGGTGTPSK
jgi:putative cell wall-binding protein